MSDLIDVNPAIAHIQEALVQLKRERTFQAFSQSPRLHNLEWCIDQLEQAIDRLERLQKSWKP